MKAFETKGIEMMYFFKSKFSFRLLFAHTITYPYRFARRKYLFSKVLNSEGLENRFTIIYRTNAWGNAQSKSGSGSSLQATRQIRLHLPLLVDNFEIKSILDAPCGDFTWMKHVNFPRRLIYIGGDIVRPLIEELQHSYSNLNRTFCHLDITRDLLPKVDLMLVRDCLFHFSFEDIMKFLENFARSNIHYLLTTSHNSSAEYSFVDIVSGDFRILDLNKEPFNFSNNSLFTIDEPPEGLLPPRSIKLWSRIQVLEALHNLKLD